MQPNLAIHHVCGLDELRLAQLSSANRVVTIPATLGEPHVVEVCGARRRVRGCSVGSAIHLDIAIESAGSCLTTDARL